MTGKVISKYQGETVELVFDATFLQLSKDEDIEIDLPPNVVNWKLKFVFTNNDKETERATDYVPIGNTAQFTLNKWYGDTWIENTKPWELESDTRSIKLYVKFRTTANFNQDLRQVHISVWRKI